jgi:hypothetical protein
VARILIICGIFFLAFFLPAVAADISESGWSLVTSDAGFTPRYEPGTVVFQDRIWVVGGDSINGSFNDVWSSSNGKEWILETEHAGFSPRSGQGTVVFNDKVWVIGGISSGTSLNDVWSSDDGRNWTLETGHAGFSPRSGHGTVVFNNKIWVIGGSGTLNDVWSSPDGSHWTLETNNANFISRQDAGVTVFDHGIWLIGGYHYSVNGRGDVTTGCLNDVWNSADGITWKLANSSAAFGPRMLCPVVTYENRIWLLGGGQPQPQLSPKEVSPGGYGQIWSSNDGVNWTPEDENPGFLPRYGSGAVVFNDTLWIVGGRDPYDEHDVWSYRNPILTSTTKYEIITPQMTNDSNQTLFPATENQTSRLSSPTKSGSDPISLIPCITMIIGILGYYLRKRN